VDGYKLTLASDVLERDGLGLELYSPDGTLIAEVFRDDDSGVRTFNSFMPLNLRPEVLAWFLDQAARRL
jgi:hypothetical protein